MRPRSIVSLQRVKTATFVVAGLLFSTAFLAMPADMRAASTDRNAWSATQLAALPRDDGLPVPATGCGEVACAPGQPARREAYTEEDIQPYDCACTPKSVTEKLAGYASPPPAG